jgi:hypothetical protein
MQHFERHRGLGMEVNAVFIETNDTRIPKLLCEYGQTDRGNLSRPNERWKGENP